MAFYEVLFTWNPPKSEDEKKDLALSLEDLFNSETMFASKGIEANGKPYQATCFSRPEGLVLRLKQPENLNRKTFETLLNATPGVIRFKTGARMSYKRVTEFDSV